VVDPLEAVFGKPALDLFASTELVASHGPLERFPAFMRSGPMANIEALCRHYAGPVEIAAGSSRDGGQVAVRDAHPVALLRLGLTVYFSDMRRSLPESQAWLKGIEQSLGLLDCTTLGAFANSRGSGLAIHHDRFDQLLFQISGEKQFRYSPNGYVERPDVQFSPVASVPADWGQTYRRRFPLTADEVLSREFRTITLKPGSAFFMPSGTWHTTSDQPGEALSLVVAVRAPSRLALLLNYLGYYAGQSPAWRAPAYRGFGDRPESEHAEFAALFDDLAKRMHSLPAANAFGAWATHGYTTGTQSEYPLGARFARYIRLPNSRVELEPDVDPTQLRCTVSSGSVNRPQARVTLGVHVESRPVLDWVLRVARAFSVDEVCTTFPDYPREELEHLFAMLSHAALLRPIPAPEWDEEISP
jgi:hypothetical protein